VLDDVLDGGFEPLVLMLEVLEALEEIIEGDDVVCSVDDRGVEGVLAVLVLS
jgi:hypothetical protein